MKVIEPEARVGVGKGVRHASSKVHTGVRKRRWATHSQGGGKAKVYESELTAGR